MSIGFKRFAIPEKIESEKAKGSLANLAESEYILWFGGTYGGRPGSGRFKSFSTIRKDEIGKPVPLSVYVKRALVAEGDGKGFSTGISVGGLGLHQIAKPTVYFYVYRDEKGNFRARKDVPRPDASKFAKPLKKGDLVLAAPK